MFAALGSLVDLVHALLMVAWVAGLPLLFWKKHPRATRIYALYAISFILAYQSSRLFLGECFLTTLSRSLWERGGADLASAPDEWFTVRLSRAIFHLAPSHRVITLAGQALILVTAVGMLIALRAHRAGRRRAAR